MSVPVLMYHGLHDDERSAGRFHPVYSVRPAEFARQLDWLVDSGRTTVRLGDVSSLPPDRKSIVLTFDDGDVSAVQTALPMLVERRLTADFFVTTDYVDEPGMLREADVRTLSEAAMGIHSHGRSHRPLSELSMAELRDELTVSKQLLEAWTGTGVNGLSLPGGRGGSREREVAASLGYDFVCNSYPGPNRRWRPGRYLQRIAVTSHMTMEEFTSLVNWHGITPCRARARTAGLEVVKKSLGYSRYDRIRSRLLSRRYDDDPQA